MSDDFAIVIRILLMNTKVIWQDNQEQEQMILVGLIYYHAQIYGKLSGNLILRYKPMMKLEAFLNDNRQFKLLREYVILDRLVSYRN
jgi:hypothetical protein